MLLIQQEGSCLTGWLEILRHKERIDGSVDENGNCQIKGIFITLLNTVPFVATGRMTDSCIHLFMEDQENRRFQMSGNLYIVDKRNLIFLIYIAAIIFSMFSRNWISVNDDITSSLSENTETRQGLTVMEEQFTTFGTARVMVSNISYEKALDLVDTLKEIEGVSAVDMGSADDADDRVSHYRESAVLYDITFKGTETDEISVSAMTEIRENSG